MTEPSWYYLHANGELIHKRREVEPDAPAGFVLAVWAIDPGRRETAWRLLTESLALGASIAQITALAAQWGCDDADALEYAARFGIALARADAPPQRTVWWLASSLAVVDGDGGIPVGRGATCLSAISDLVRQTGVPHTPWTRWYG